MAGHGPPGNLTDARVVDPRTVDFVLSKVDPTFLTTVVPVVLPRHAVAAAHAGFMAPTRSLKAAGHTALDDSIKETSSDPPVCAPRLDSAATILARNGYPLYREDSSHSTGTFDMCGCAAMARAACGLFDP